MLTITFWLLGFNNRLNRIGYELIVDFADDFNDSLESLNIWITATSNHT